MLGTWGSEFKFYRVAKVIAGRGVSGSGAFLKGWRSQVYGVLRALRSSAWGYTWFGGLSGQ